MLATSMHDCRTPDLYEHCCEVPGHISLAVDIDVQATHPVDRGPWHGSMLGLTI